MYNQVLKYIFAAEFESNFVYQTNPRMSSYESTHIQLCEMYLPSEGCQFVVYFWSEWLWHIVIWLPLIQRTMMPSVMSYLWTTVQCFHKNTIKCALCSLLQLCMRVTCYLLRTNKPLNNIKWSSRSSVLGLAIKGTSREIAQYFFLLEVKNTNFGTLRQLNVLFFGAA